MVPRFRARRCARQVGQITASGTQNIAIGLFNNSTGRDLLVVRYMEGLQQSSIDFPHMYYMQGQLSGTPKDGVNLVTGEANPSGQVSTQVITTIQTPDYIPIGVFTNNQHYDLPFPIAVLQPGWSFVIAAPTPDGFLLIMNFLWQMCTAEEIDGSLEDFALKLAGS